MYVLYIYCAGGFHERVGIGIGEFMIRLEEMSTDYVKVVITHDWTSNELNYDDEHQRNIRCARADINGVLQAEIMVACMTDDNYPYRGTRHEIGAALASKQIQGSPHIWVIANGTPMSRSKPEPLKSCFMDCADRYFNDQEEVLEALKQYMGNLPV